MLDKSAILAVQDLPSEVVDVPEWGGQVRVRTMTGAERDRFEEIFTSGGRKDIRATIAAFCLVDDAGQRLFSDADIPELSRKSSAALDRILVASRRVSKITGDDIEELKKNSNGSPSADSASGLPDGTIAVSAGSSPTTTPQN